MRGKPDISKLLSPKKDINTFLDGAVADQSEIKSIDSSVGNLDNKSSAVKSKELKAFRLSIELINLLRRQAFERTEETGSRVTETMLVEEALRNYFKDN
jgi:hypothetical protein